MHKAMIFLTRRNGLSREDFRAWWLHQHRELAERLPGLRRHAFNLLAEGRPYDAVVEQWFDTRENLEGSYQTVAGKAVAADSAANIGYRLRVAAEEHWFEPPKRVI